MGHQNHNRTFDFIKNIFFRILLTSDCNNWKTRVAMHLDLVECRNINRLDEILKLLDLLNEVINRNFSVFYRAQDTELHDAKSQGVELTCKREMFVNDNLGGIHTGVVRSNSYAIQTSMNFSHQLQEKNIYK